MTVRRVPAVVDGTAEIGAAALAFGAYRASVLPTARGWIERWLPAAERIPDPVLRAAAVSSLREKRANVEAVAVLATLAPRRRRRAVLAAITALQVVVDYLDTLGEETAAADPLADGLALHGALAAALTPAAPDSPPAGWYAHHPRDDDGGYLTSLVDASRAAALTLPSAAAVLPHARSAARRCGEGQSLVHAGSGLEAWARTLPAPAGLRWWEAAAGASSSVAAHALIALAGTPGASTAAAERVHRAYDPWIGALTVILDDLLDSAEDRARGEHSYLDHYAGPAEAAARIDMLAAGARATLAGLPRRHAAILAGVLSYHLGERPPGSPLSGTNPRAAAAPAVRFLAAVSGRGR